MDHSYSLQAFVFVFVGANIGSWFVVLYRRWKKRPNVGGSNSHDRLWKRHCWVAQHSLHFLGWIEERHVAMLLEFAAAGSFRRVGTVPL